MQNRSRRFCTRLIPETRHRGSLRSCKIAPGDFVEPMGFSPLKRTNKKAAI
jgi:hypothetical protein